MTLPQVKEPFLNMNFLNFDKQLQEIFNNLNQMQFSLENDEIDFARVF